MLEVEEDPSSQFVDFTNATALEQFVSDAEQTLIAWHLTGKGHASAEALEATHNPSKHANTTYTRVLEFEQPQRNADGSSSSTQTQTVKYALTLFLTGKSSSRNGGIEINARAKLATPTATTNGKQWAQGREHFTPTMLAIADSSRDLTWRSEGAAACGETSSYDESQEDTACVAAIARDAECWFGVEEFLLVTRTSLPAEREEMRLQQQQQQPMSRRGSRAQQLDDAPVKDPTEEGGATRSGRQTAAFDGSMDANEANLLLSAIHLALLNCNCTIPAFVPIQNVSNGTWLGTAVPGSTGNVSITFETDSIPEVNSNQSCISGLMDFFQLKLQLPAEVEDLCRLASSGDAAELSVGTWVSAAFHYAWQKNADPREVGKPVLEWRYVPAPDAKTTGPSPDFQQLKKTLFGNAASPEHYWGTTTNPVIGIDLAALWPNLREGTYVDNAVHSTLDPQTAPEWMIDVQLDSHKNKSDWKRGLYDLSRKPTMPLSRIVTNLVQAYAKARDLSRDILVSELAPTLNTPQPPPQSASTTATSSTSASANAHASSSSRLPESIPAARAAVVIGNAIGSITSSIVSAATWKGTDVEEIQRVVAELFDVEISADTNNKMSLASAVAHSAPVGELVSVLACRMGQLQGVNAMSLLWVEFVKALRERWFQQRLLPLMSTSSSGDDGQYDGMSTRSLDTLFLLESTTMTLPNPDFHQCLLHQKLQLLNSCILRQAERRKTGLGMPTTLRRLSATGSAAVGTKMADLTAFAFEEEDGDDDDDGSPSDDEFFDSIETHDSDRELPEVKPAGVLRPLPGLVCLLTQAPMMEPITQVAVPLTEDIAKQQQDLLSRLGVGFESTRLRQQLQSAALVSDIQAFKAANPDACLADFIRWYSPKDWISVDSLTVGSLPSEGENVWWFPGQGMLSERMRGGGAAVASSPSSASSPIHLWHQMWETSLPTPVSKQKCLFDPVGESEKLYHYLETISPHEMFHQMLVGAISSCFTVLERGCLPVRVTVGSVNQSKISTVDKALQELRGLCSRAVALLDEALAESQVALPAGRDQKDEQEKAKSHLRVAFEMALDACRAMAHKFEEVEMLLSQTSALLQYFAPNDTITDESLELVDWVLAVSHNHVAAEQLATARHAISSLLRRSALRTRVASLVLENPTSKDPVQREYVIRCICPRPFLDDYQYLQDREDGEEYRPTSSHQEESAILDLVDESPVVVNRMYASFTKHTVRFALTLAESEF